MSDHTVGVGLVTLPPAFLRSIKYSSSKQTWRYGEGGTRGQRSSGDSTPSKRNPPNCISRVGFSVLDGLRSDAKTYLCLCVWSTSAFPRLLQWLRAFL
jgi:hypothetical protein